MEEHGPLGTPRDAPVAGVLGQGSRAGAATLPRAVRTACAASSPQECCHGPCDRRRRIAAPRLAVWWRGGREQEHGIARAADLGPTSGDLHGLVAVVQHQFFERAHGRDVDVPGRALAPHAVRPLWHPGENLAGDLDVTWLITQQQHQPVVPARQVGQRHQQQAAGRGHAADFADNGVEVLQVVHHAEAHDGIKIAIGVGHRPRTCIAELDLHALAPCFVDNPQIDVETMDLAGTDVVTDKSREASEPATDVQEASRPLRSQSHRPLGEGRSDRRTCGCVPCPSA